MIPSTHVQAHSTLATLYPNDPVRETRLRRQLPVELAEIAQYRENDETTQEIRRWYECFMAALRSNADEQAVLATYIALLQEILQDPLFSVPLDEESVLGSDGRTYSSRALYLYFLTVPAEFRTRGPLDPANPIPFTTAPHPLITFMVQWLKRHNAYSPSSEMEQAYQQLYDQTQLPIIFVIPSRDENVQLLQELMAEQRERDYRQTQRIQSNTAQIVSNITQRSSTGRGALDALEEEIRTFARETFSTLDTIERNEQQRIAALRNVQGQLQREIDSLENSSRELDRRLDTIQSDVMSIEKEHVQMQKDINELRIAIKKRKKKRAENLGIAIAVVGGCMFSTWALQGALSSMGSSANVTLVPSSGGAGIALAFRL